MEGIITWSIFASWFFNRTLSIYISIVQTFSSFSRKCYHYLKMWNCYFVKISQVKKLQCFAVLTLCNKFHLNLKNLSNQYLGTWNNIFSNLTTVRLHLKRTYWQFLIYCVGTHIQNIFERRSDAWFGFLMQF